MKREDLEREVVSAAREWFLDRDRGGLNAIFDPTLQRLVSTVGALIDSERPAISERLLFVGGSRTGQTQEIRAGAEHWIISLPPDAREEFYRRRTVAVRVDGVRYERDVMMLAGLDDEALHTVLLSLWVMQTDE